MNISHENFTLELENDDLSYWNTLDLGEKDHKKLLRALTYSIHDYLSREAQIQPSQFILNCHYSRSNVVRELNRQYRNKDKDTDVLSFPLFEDLEEVTEGVPAILGDIYISLDQACLQAVEYDIDLSSELIHLIIHGFFHLIGFDHERSSEEEKLMSELEQKMVKRVQNTYSKI